MKRVLILGVAAVQLDAILQLKKLGYEVHACAREADGKGAEFADYFVELDFSNKDKVIEYIKDHDIDAVYSVGSDLAMPISASISEELGLPHFVSSKTAEICNNKNLLREHLGYEFKGNIRYQIIENINDEIQLPFPFILKPSDSQGQRGVVLINSLDDFTKSYNDVVQYSRSGLVIIETYISGQEISVNGYVKDGTVLYCLPSDRNTWPEYTGLIHRHVIPSTLDSPSFNEKIYDLLSRACTKLNIDNGPVYGQFKMEGDEPYIIEITPRLDGCHMWNLIKYSHDINLLEITLKHLVEGEINEDIFNELSDIEPHYLEFVCEAPHTEASYTGMESELDKSLHSFKYYNEGDTVRPINGQFEKIAYFINSGEVDAD